MRPEDGAKNTARVINKHASITEAATSITGKRNRRTYYATSKKFLHLVVLSGISDSNMIFTYDNRVLR